MKNLIDRVRRQYRYEILPDFELAVLMRLLELDFQAPHVVLECIVQTDDLLLFVENRIGNSDDVFQMVARPLTQEYL